jgi:hypothetical protein
MGGKPLFPFPFLHFITENGIWIGKVEIGCGSGMYRYSETDKYGPKDNGNRRNQHKAGNHAEAVVALGLAVTAHSTWSSSNNSDGT